jgi:hypothetical protein
MKERFNFYYFPKEWCFVRFSRTDWCYFIEFGPYMLTIKRNIVL